MALSPNYSWSEPDNSSLVKNGAADIRTLGDAIDTSVWNVGFGQAGKNKIINGDFGINQRAFTSTTTSFTYGHDRWQLLATDGTTTYSTQAFTPGAAPVAGYESTNYARLISTGQTLASARSVLTQRIESVRTFAGQTATVSFWAKAASGTPFVAVNFTQYFGSAGSTNIDVLGQKVAITSSWARYSLTFAIPSVSGKTITTSDYLQIRFYTSGGSNENNATASMGIQSATIDIWGVQVEYGSKATPFQTASGGSQQAELAMCQRYYVRFGGNMAYENFGSAFATSTTQALCLINLPVTQRIAATAVEYSTNALYEGVGFSAVTAFSINGNSTNQIRLQATVASGLTQYRPYDLLANASTSAYLGFSAEL